MIEVYQDKAGYWRWRRKARNGRITAESGEGYSSEGNCLAAVHKMNAEEGEPIRFAEKE